MAFIRVYTEKITENKYPASLAHSVHFAVSREGKSYQSLNQGYGILFARAAVREDNTIAERGIQNPRLRKEGEEYLIYAEPLDENWAPLEGGYLVWKTKDFVCFSQQEWVENAPGAEELEKPEAASGAGEREKPETVSGAEGHGKPGAASTAEGQEKSGTWPVAEELEIPEELLAGIYERWIPLYSVSAQAPAEVRIKSLDELERVRVSVTYSDDSSDDKPVSWKRESLISLDDGKYRVNGTMEPVNTGFPLAAGYADPVLFFWKGAWYFLATNDNVNDIGLFVRRSDTVAGLFAEDVKEYCILEYNEEKGFCQTFWAPEFHVIGGALYILFAVGGKQWAPQCHMMRLKEGGEITDPASWEEPVRVCRADGRPLTEDGITLDMTYFEAGENSYVCWSYRYGIGTPKDTGSMLYIATVDDGCPYRLTSEPVLLSRPLYGWENTSGTINNEGPYALILGDTVYLSYSGGDACGYYYAVGCLTAFAGSDLLDAGNWTKLPTPVLSSSSIEGIQGPGHNSFFRDEQGRLMIAYHAQEREKHFKRCSAFHRVHLSKSGFPLLNVAGERDLAEELREVELTFTMEP